MAELLARTLIFSGLTTPSRRALAFGAAGFAFQFAFAPSISYTKEGVAKSIGLFNYTDEYSDEENSVPTTLFPWYAWPISFALMGGLFL